MTNSEFNALLADESKRINSDIDWLEDEDHSPSVEFRVEVESNSGWPLFVKGTYNRRVNTLSFTLIHRNHGRIYALDLGKDHHNPSCNHVGEKHKHRWTEEFRDKDAYVPEDITASAECPLDVWRQFCVEAKISHSGRLHTPPVIQEELL